jgi:GNAT superfamily N-acetyltransferase
MSGAPVIRPLSAGEADACERLLRSLPDWFGIEQAIREYRRDVEDLETLVAEVAGEVAAFLTLLQHSPYAAEIRVMAVERRLHRSGLGRALVGHAEGLLRSRAVEYLQVKTLGPSRPNAEYERTRRFYEALGFRPLEETRRIWDEHNPCLILVKRL